MRKKGSGHIDVIVGFIIFALAISLAVYYFKPVTSERVEETALRYIVDKIYGNVSVELENYPVSITKSNLPASQIIALNLGINLESDENIAVREEAGNFLDYDLDPNKINVDWKGSNFIFFNIAKDLDDNSKSVVGVEVNESYYRIGASRTLEIISERRLLLLNKSYYGSYQEVKRYFNLPARVNFGFSLVLPDGKKIESFVPRNDRGEVFSQNIKVEILNSSGYKKMGELKVEIW